MHSISILFGMFKRFPLLSAFFGVFVAIFFTRIVFGVFFIFWSVIGCLYSLGGLIRKVFKNCICLCVLDRLKLVSRRIWMGSAFLRVVDGYLGFLVFEKGFLVWCLGV